MVEVTKRRKPKKGNQIDGLIGDKRVNPKGKSVIALAPKLSPNKVKEYKGKGAKIVKNNDELRDELKSLAKKFRL